MNVTMMPNFVPGTDYLAAQFGPGIYRCDPECTKWF